MLELVVCEIASPYSYFKVRNRSLLFFVATLYFFFGAHLVNIVFLWLQTISHRFKRIRLDLSHNPSSFDTIPQLSYCPELMLVRNDVTKWRRAFLLWKKPEVKLSKMVDVQIKKMTTGFGFFSTLSKGKSTFIAFNFKSKLFLNF